MENKFFQKAKLATAIALVSSTTLLTGCLVDGDRSSSVTTSSTAADPANNFERVANPVGTVVGLVQDIQGNPISGATVSIAGRTTTTTSAGTYQFTDIPVTDVVVNASTSTASANESNAVLGNSPALIVSIQPPAGYLGATVTVTAPASVIDYGADDNCTDSNAGSTVTCAANANTHSFIDGFLAQAGTAVLPALNASVTGILRDSVTGEAMANTEVTLEMLGTYDSTGTDTIVLPNAAMNNGATISYGVQNVVTTTDADGQFVFTNVPSKSELAPRVAGHTTLSVQANQGQVVTTLSTNNWTTAVEVGAVMVTPIVQVADQLAPFVTRVDSVTNGTPGLFNDDIDVTASGTGLVVHFSEPLADSVDAASIENSVEVLVWDDTGAAAGDAVYNSDEFGTGDYATINDIVISADRTSMTLTLASNLTEGQSIHVNMLTIDFTDTAGNQLIANPAPTMTYDSLLAGASTNNGNFVRLGMSTFVDINKGAPAVTATQGTEDTTGVDVFQDLTAINSVFSDVKDGDSVIQHLNATDDDGVLANDASSRLNALQAAIGGITVAAPALAVDGDQAIITFTPNSASGYIIAVQDELGVSQTTYANITVVTGNVLEATGANVLNGANGSVITVTDSNDVSLVLDNVEAGWAVSIIPVDDLGYGFGVPTSETLEDLVPPTTVLQTSYGVTTVSDYLVTGETFGEGGELVNEGDAQGGIPYLNITAQLLDNLSADGTPTLETADDDDSLIAELAEKNTIDSSTGLPYITGANAPYDPVAYTAMATAAARSMGVAFSEDIARLTDPTYSGSVGLVSNWAVANDITQNDKGANVSVDLMTFDVASVFTLAADDSAIIDFTDGITDTATTPNTAVASANAKVKVRDALPPFIVSGTYNGENVTLEFNETIVPVDGDKFEFRDAGVIIPPAVTETYPTAVLNVNDNSSLNNFTLGSVNGGTDNQLIIAKEAWGADLDLVAAFSLPAYSGSNEHGTISFNDIEDVNGNNWTDDAYGISPVPTFALLAGVEPVMTLDSVAATGNGLTTATITVTASHAIDGFTPGATATVDLSAGGTNQLVFTDNGSGAVPNLATASVTMNAAGTVMTITVTSTGAYATNDTFSVQNIVSDWDSSQTAPAVNDNI